MKSLKIGPVRLRNRLFLAPMVDVTDLPYRLLCRREGAAIAYTEMLNIGSILHAKNVKTANIMKTSKDDKPVGIQITGKSIEDFRKVSGREELRKFDLVDINCGCPSSRITDNESGSWLLKTPEKIGDMIRILKAGDSERVVTAKIRLGFKNNNVIRVSKEIEKAGADLLTIHARLANQKNNVPADWLWIAKVKREIGIPVIGNGGILDGESAGKMLDICDGAMIASAAIGNPAIFREILYYLRNDKERSVSSKERVQMFSEYLTLARKYEVVEMPRIRYLGGQFLRGFDGAAKAREDFMRLREIDEMAKFVKSL